MRSSFVPQNKNNQRELFGTITDGQFKLDMLLTKGQEDVDIERGTRLQIIGDLQVLGNQ